MDRFTVRDLAGILNDAQLRYLVVGGVAVISHGYGRATRDVDVVLDLDDREGLARALAGLEHAGFRSRAPVPLAAFADPENRRRWIEEKEMVVFSLHRGDRGRHEEVDLFVSQPFDLPRAWEQAVRVTLPGDVTMAVLDLEELVRMKRVAGRPQDIADVAELEAIHGPVGDG